MDTKNQEPIILNMETDSNINTIKQVNKPRGRPKQNEQITK